MPDDPPQPDNELTQLISKIIQVGAVAGAETAARQITQAVGLSLDKVKASLEASLGPVPGQPVTVIAQTATATASALAPVVSVQLPAAVVLAGVGTLSVSREEVQAAADELSTAGPSDPETLGGRPPAKWTKRELIVNSLFLVVVVYWLLPAAVQAHLVDIAHLAAGVEAIVSLLLGGS